MHRKLLLMAFDKVRGEFVGEGNLSPSLNQCAIRLSEIVSEDFPYSPKSFNTLHKKAKENEESDFNIPRPEVVPVLVKYVGFNNYEEFVLLNKERVQERINDGDLLISPSGGPAKENNKPTLERDNKSRLKRIYVLMSVSVVAIIISVYFYENRQKWMVWNGQHYEVKSFDPELEKNGVLNLYDENNYHYLKKIIPTCDTQFFNGDGSVRIWYGKNSRKEYEFFTALGEHPETGKSLKPITKYMIGKYICP